MLVKFAQTKYFDSINLFKFKKIKWRDNEITWRIKTWECSRICL